MQPLQFLLNKKIELSSTCKWRVSLQKASQKTNLKTNLKPNQKTEQENESENEPENRKFYLSSDHELSQIKKV